MFDYRLAHRILISVFFCPLSDSIPCVMRIQFDRQSCSITLKNKKATFSFCCYLSAIAKELNCIGKKADSVSPLSP
jgi:hypothetical protein